MTAKEKALSIYNGMVVDFGIDKEQSRECAKQAVILVMSELDPVYAIDRLNYYKQVLVELDLL